MNHLGSVVDCRAVGAGRLAHPARAAWLGLAVGLIFSVVLGRASAQSVWELTPYRIQLVVAVSPTAGASGTRAADLRRSLCVRAETVVGARWDVTTVEPSPRLHHRMCGDLESVRFEDLPEGTDKFDKVFLVAIVSRGGGQEVHAREVDVRTRIFSPIVRLPVWQTAKVRDTAFRAMLDVFTPLAQIISTTAKEVTLRLRAGGLPVRDLSLPSVRPGDVFQPMMRYSDREGQFRKTIVIPWTFLVVDKYDPKDFRCALYSALLSPMSGRRRGRVESLALAVRPAGRTTRILLRGRVEPKPLLAGYQVYEQQLGGKKTKPLGRTDIDGGIDIGPGEHPLRLVLVRSGKALLARLPVVPGLAPELIAEIRDDDQRLEAEGFNTAVQLDLIDMVTRQQILIARARDLLKAGEVDEAAKLVDELQAMPAEDTLMLDLNNRQGKIRVEDKWTQKKVDELFDETRALLKKHLSSEPVRQLAREVAAARQKPQEKGAP